MDNAKFARLGRILELLHKGETLSIRDLSEEFGVSERTLQRDIYQRLGDRVIKVNGTFQRRRDADSGVGAMSIDVGCHAGLCVLRVLRY